MDMAMGVNMFQTTNMALARAFWYIVAGVVGLAVAVRAVNAYDASIRLRTHAAGSYAHPTQPRSAGLRAWATLTAVVREASYPQLYVPVRWFTWLTPPPAGRVAVLLVYWAVIVGFMCAHAVVHDVYFWERIGFRNAWVTVTQLPLLYLLAGKTSVLATLTGTSHERLNWLHRWVARTMFVTASVHGWHFYTEYARAGLTSDFFQIMPMGRYGIAAWALLLWSFVVGMAPLRHLCYEVFVVQHIVTAVVLLWAVYRHVPAYARYNVWFAIAALCLDRAVRLLLLVWQNVKLRRPDRSRCRGGQRIGHAAQLRAVGEDTTIVTIKDVHFRWRAGQHLYLWLPAIGPLEQHPYTIACAHQLPDTCICNSIQLVVRKHGGFSKRLHDRAARLQAPASAGSGAATNAATFTAFVSGPFGEPARWDIYETLVLLSASTGASFTLPILESVLQAQPSQTLCTKRVDFLLAAKKGDEIGYYVERLHELVEKARDTPIELTVTVAVTQDRAPLFHPLQGPSGSSSGPKDLTHSASSSVATTSSAEKADGDATPAGTGSGARTSAGGPAACCMAPRDVEKSALLSRAARHRSSAGSSITSSSSASSGPYVRQLTSRPDIAAFVRAAVEASGGETSVVVCGGKSLVARTRNCVAQLSDERAVHKGTGAQGIHLHVEEYDF